MKSPEITGFVAWNGYGHEINVDLRDPQQALAYGSNNSEFSAAIKAQEEIITLEKYGQFKESKASPSQTLAETLIAAEGEPCTLEQLRLTIYARTLGAAVLPESQRRTELRMAKKTERLLTGALTWHFLFRQGYYPQHGWAVAERGEKEATPIAKPFIVYRAVPTDCPPALGQQPTKQHFVHWRWPIVSQPR